MAKTDAEKRTEPRHEREVKILAFPYTVPVEDPYRPGTFGRVEQLGQRGETITVNDIDLERGDRLNAFVTEQDREAREAAGEETLVIETASVPDLADWIREDKPKVQEVIDASGGNSEVAARLIEAENVATGGEPRRTVVDGLTEVIARDN